MKAALSLDIDNKWSYMKTHGGAGWESFPSYLDVLVPRVLDFLDRLNLRITFFVVGQDAALASNRDMLHELSRRGHEIGNHSFHHEPWMHRHSEESIDEEFARAEESIEAATGCRPHGFRGPGFTCSPAILSILARRGYLYDASTLPTFIGPLARAYYFRSTHLSKDEMRDREDLFGHFSDGFQPNRQHRVRANGSSIVEIPVTTMPLSRLPIHISYVLYAATISPGLARAYFNTAIALCRATRTEPSILLHPLDFLSGNECPELAFFPAMNLDLGLKLSIVERSLRTLAKNFEVVPLGQFALPYPSQPIETRNIHQSG